MRIASRYINAFLLFSVFLIASSASAQTISLRTKLPDPYGYPRPYNNETSVPLRTSYYIELSVADQTDAVLPDATTMTLTSSGIAAVPILYANRAFAPGYTGTFSNASTTGASPKRYLVINVDSTVPLLASRTYTVNLVSRSSKGALFSGGIRKWSFTTEAAPATHTVVFDLNLNNSPIRWEGGFFNGFVKPSYCTTDVWGRRPGYDLMRQVQDTWSTKAWSLQRDWWITGFNYQESAWGPGLSSRQPNIVRERETRRIHGMTTEGLNTRLFVQDFFGHQQYGIPSGRPLAPDYQPGNIILVADGIVASTGTVISVDQSTSSVLVSGLAIPAAGFQINYSHPLPTQEEPGAPGLFASGGTYLRKFNPVGTMHFYWGRNDYELDIVHGIYGRRMVVNFCDAPGDLSIDGGSFTTAKDMAQMHEAARIITDHLIKRYGEAMLDCYWEIGNENDHPASFWRINSWAEFQRFYDYTADGILRAFEDNGLDSSKVIIGGLAFGRIKTAQGPVGYRTFLAHASPAATYDHPETLELNQAYADPRLNGKRSQRVEQLCAANGGKGTPFDFVDPHFYMSAQNTAEHMIWCKEVALEMDPVYFANLAVGTNEACPSWNPPPDLAADDSYLGNGYFETWTADVIGRRLRRAALDARYGSGEFTYTFWPWPPSNFGGLNGSTMVLDIDSDGNGSRDSKATIAMPTLYLAGMIGSMGDDLWALPEQTVNGHVVSGFAGRTSESVRLLLYSHHQFDTQSRSDRGFDVWTTITGLSWSLAHVQDYRIDKGHNTVFPVAKELGPRDWFGSYTPAMLAKAQDAATLRPTQYVKRSPTNGKFRIPAKVAGNGINFIILTAQEPTPLPTPPTTATPTPTSTRTPTRTLTPSPTPTITPTPGILGAQDWAVYE